MLALLAALAPAAAAQAAMLAPAAEEGQSAAAIPVAATAMPQPRPEALQPAARPAAFSAEGGRVLGQRANPQELRATFNAVERGQWAEAMAAAKRTGSHAIVDYVEWFRYTRRDSGATFAEIAAYVDSHPGWPWQITLRTRAEEAIGPGTDPLAMMAWFQRHPPVSGIGMVHYGAALIDAGQVEEGTSWIRRGWREGEFDAAEEARIVRVHGSRLRAEDHEARLDRLLWEHETDAATRAMAYVSPGYRAVAKARIALYRDAKDVNALLDQVPVQLRRDPGLTYERLRWRKRHGLEDGVREILESPPEDLGKADRWWRLREQAAREALDRGAWQEAYRLASQHGQTEGATYADAEWLAGWIALRFLHDPMKAVSHFLPMFEKVTYPISKSRAAYWIARSAEALGEDVRARQWYAEAALHPTTYYGQLARIALGDVGPMPLPATVRVAPDQERAFFGDPRVQVVLALAHTDHDWRARPFVMALMEEARTPLEYSMVVHLSELIGRSELSVRAIKSASQKGLVDVAGGYPVLPELVQAARGIEPALVHAISRQESEFRVDAVSRAGARGIMQLMPGTAEQVARSLRLPYDQARLTTDPAYNAQLGASYMKDLLRRWDDHYVLAIASYNAGPGRVVEWTRRNGDPRTQQVDIIDWVERIPFAETRNYVQRVLEGLQVYRTLLGEGRLLLADDLRSR